jgi:hypothetical protein
MARIEYIRHRLENWARWSSQRESGSLGYPKQSPFARFTAGSGNDGVPVSALDASEIDDAVRALQLTKSHLYLTLKWHYARGYTINRVATTLCKAPSTIKRHLEDADRAISFWLDAKAEIQQANLERMKKG